MSLDPRTISEILHRDFGRAWQVDSSRFPLDGSISVRPDIGTRGRGLIIDLHRSVSVIDVRLTPESFAVHLCAKVAAATEAQRRRFVESSKMLERLRARVSLTIDGVVVNPEADNPWPKGNPLFTIDIHTHPGTEELLHPGDLNQQMAFWAGAAFELLSRLITSGEAEAAELMPLCEGTRTRVERNRYERNPINRRACIEAHGTTCKVCGFDFETAYGELGRGFIHVHHVVPVSQLGDAYLIDPVKDLIPLCPNCHSMVHIKDPPYTPDDLRAMIAERRAVAEA